MAATIQNNFRTRKNFAKIQKIIDIPNLIDIQKHSYDKFLQADVASEQREDSGLQGVFKSVFPIKDFNETSSLEFVSYHLEKPKYDVDECHQRGMTYSAPIKVVVRLVVWDKDPDTGAQSIRDVKEQEVYFGEIPLMTENGTFIINGTERVVVSQLHRSPGAFFDHDKGKSHSSGKLLYNARIIPYRGSWIDFEFDHKDILYVRIDRRRKLPATVLLRALGAVPDTAKKNPLDFKGTPEEILNYFYATETIYIGEKGKYEKSVELELLPGQRATRDIKNPKTGEVIVKKNRKFTRGAIKKLEQAKIRTLPLDVEELVTKISARDVVDENTGEVLLECNEEVTEEKVEQLRERGIDQFQVLFIDNLNVGPFLRDTLMADKIASPEEAIMEIYRRLRPGDPPTLETATNLFVNLFFNPERYDLSKVGRLKLNYKFGIDEPLEQAVLTKKDILEVVRYLIDLKNGKGAIDDIDHLGNRRVPAVRELLENQYRIGLVRIDRVSEYGFVETAYRQVVEGRVTDEVKFYSALEEEKHVIAQANAAFDKKGHFVTPLVSCRKAGEFPQARPEDISLMDVSPNQLVSVAASLIPFLENDDANRALMGSNMQRQAVPLLRTVAPLVGTGIEGTVARDSGVCTVCRRDGVVDQVDAGRIVVRAETKESSMDVASEVDIYNLIKYQRSNQNTCINQKPIVKGGDRVRKGDVIADGPATETGELALGQNVIVAFMPWQGYNFEDSILVSERILRDDVFTSIHIEEFECIARDTKLGKEEITRDIPNVGEEALKDLDESGIIRIGAEVKPGDILVGKVTPEGETQLSPEEKLLRAIFGEKAGDVRDASLYCPPGIEGVIVDVKIFSRKGQEKDERAKAIEATQIAKLEKNLSDQIRILTDERLKRLENILGGKEVLADLHDERTNKRLLTKDAILDRDTIERISTRNLKRIKYADKDPRVNEQIDEIEEMTSRQIDVLKKIVNERKDKLTKGDELPPGVIKLVKVYIAMKRKLSVGDKMAGRHGNKGVIARILPEEDMPYLEDGTAVEIVLNPLGVPSRMNVGQILETHLGWAGHELGGKIAELLKENSKEEVIRRELKALFKDTTLADAISELDDEELAALAPTLTRGVFTGSPVFDGSKESEIKALLRSSGLPESGKTYLYDGMTGEKFEQPVTVGYIYMLKLSHLVDDKIHARSIGPYSLITQQPLGGKAQFGGQRFGEMEVWALEAYGAAFILQELLTAKSDDVYGRTKIYEAIVKGEAAMEPGVPESFNVLIRELQSLCLDVELIKAGEKKPVLSASTGADGYAGAKTRGVLLEAD